MALRFKPSRFFLKGMNLICFLEPIAMAGMKTQFACITTGILLVVTGGVLIPVIWNAIKHSLMTKVCICLYFCLFVSLVHICVLLHLQHIQNTAAHVVTLSRKLCHITPILKELHWLPVSQRIVFKLMLIVHKSFNNIAPIYISKLLKIKTTPSRNLHSSNMSLLKEPTSKRTWGDRSFSVAAPRLWNHLSTKLKSCHSITRFKSLLKTHLNVTIFQRCIFVIALYMYLGT